MTITLTITFYSRIHSLFILVNFYQKHKSLPLKLAAAIL